MTGRCYDFPGPVDPVIATSDGWVPLDEQHAADLAASGMLLSSSPEHAERLKLEARRRAQPHSIQRDEQAPLSSQLAD